MERRAMSTLEEGERNHERIYAPGCLHGYPGTGISRPGIAVAGTGHRAAFVGDTGWLRRRRTMEQGRRDANAGRAETGRTGSHARTPANPRETGRTVANLAGGGGSLPATRERHVGCATALLPACIPRTIRRGAF